VPICVYLWPSLCVSLHFYSSETLAGGVTGG
jgi:hypothetical protein